MPDTTIRQCLDETTDTSARGLFITLEGVDGVGKSTQADLLAEALMQTGKELVRLREPGGTAISEKIRALLLDASNTDMVDECELLLYEASRAQLVRQVIEPALARGAIVLCDRFYDSTFAYQAGGRGIDEKVVRRANDLGSCGVVPTRTLIFDLEPAEAFQRATTNGADRMEAEGAAFQRCVREAYIRLSVAEPSRVHVVSAYGTIAEVHARTVADLCDLVPEIQEAKTFGLEVGAQDA